MLVGDCPKLGDNWFHVYPNPVQDSKAAPVRPLAVALLLRALCGICPGLPMHFVLVF